MPKTQLTAVSRTQGNNRALKAGEVALPDFELTFEEVSPLPKAFRRMVREGAYDISEMALTTFLCAKAHGADLVGLPIFLVRDFHHKAMVKPAGVTFASPRDLEGQRVGVSRGYTVTTGVWARAILAEEHGVDLSRVTWVRSDAEHVTAYAPPANVKDLDGDAGLEAQVADGTLAAAVGLGADGQITASLIDDPDAAGRAAFLDRGFYPINHLVVVRRDVLEANPGLARQLFEAFAESKQRYVAALKAGQVEVGAAERLYETVMTKMDDPLPYGIAPNQATLETLMAQAVSQQILPGPIALEQLFAAETLDAVG